MKEKRISFGKQNAEHIYEYLRFYWATDYLDTPEFWTKNLMKECGKFGCCAECEQIGKRLENFIGSESVKFVDNLIKKYIKQRINEKEKI